MMYNSPQQLFCGAGSAMGTSLKIIGGSVLLGIGAIISFAGYLALKRFANVLWYHLLSSVEVSGSLENRCDTRSHLLEWLECNVVTKLLPHIHIVTDNSREENGKTICELKNNPNRQTTHYFTYKGHWVFLSRRFVENVISDKATWESITLFTLRMNSWVLGELMEEVRLLFEEKPPPQDKTRFYTPVAGYEGYWAECGNGKKKRPLSSVILNSAIAKKFLSDLHEFLDAAKWYQDRGIPYRRGYLLYGPPGCGKSSLVKAMSGEIDYNICILSLSTKGLNDDTLNSLMNSTPEKSVILLEDVDVAFPKRDVQPDNDDKKKNETDAGKVTLRGLLNALDGVASTEGRVIFLTTNYIDRLDSAMTRPGRVDLKIFIDVPDDNQLLRMFTRFYSDANEETDGKEFIRKIRALKKPKVTMAMVQGLFMMHKYDYKEMINGVEHYFEEQFFSITEKNHESE